MPNIPLGKQGEEIAARFLRRLGYRLLERNFACKSGEIDIIALDRDEIVFVEVRSRAKADDFLPEASITPPKQRRVRAAAQAYCRHRGLDNPSCRADVVAIILPPDAKPRIEHYQNAFPLA